MICWRIFLENMLLLPLNATLSAYGQTKMSHLIIWKHHKATIVIRPEDIAKQLQRAQQAKAAIKMENESILRARAAASARRARTILLKSLGQ